MRGASTRTSAAADLVESGRGQRQTATWPLQHDKDLIGCRGARPFGVVVGGHRGEELSRDRHDPLATALALGDEQATLSRVQVGHPQAQYFAASQAGQQHGLDHCAVPVCAQHGQERLRLGRFDHAWQGVWCPDERGSPHPWTTTTPPGCQSTRDGVGRHAGVPTRDQVGIQPRDAGQPSLDRAGRQARLAVLQTHHRRAPPRGPSVVRLEDGEAGLSARTIKRRLASISGLYAYLIARGDAGVTANPVPRGLATRGRRGRPGVRGAPLIRAPRTLPRVIEPAEAEAFLAVLRTDRDRAMVQAMLLAGLRRCEVLGLRMADLHPGERRLFIAEGKGGRQRIVPISAQFFTTVAAYYDAERPRTSATDQVFVVLKGPRRGLPLSPAGLDQIVGGARARAGIAHLTCHQLRHTCFTRLREAGMALEAIQAQAGHASIESTRIYLHLANDWLADEYRRASEAIDAQALELEGDS